MKKYEHADEKMSRIGSNKTLVLDSLDKAIIDAVKREQFMTCREIWTTVYCAQPNASPGLVYRRTNNLAELGLLGFMEKKLGDSILRRYYCFQDQSDSLQDGYSFIETQ